MCGTIIFLLFTCYVIDIFSFSFTFFPIGRSMPTYESNEFANRFVKVFLEFSWEVDINNYYYGYDYHYHYLYH